MPFTDPISSVSGRNSRASNVSGTTGASRSIRSQRPLPNDTLANVGVLSMLKTSTDTGDIGALSFNTSRLPTVLRTSRPLRDHAVKPSVSAQHVDSATISNHSYAPSQISRLSSQWDTGSTQRRGSLTSMQSMPPSLPPVPVGKPSVQAMLPSPDNARDSRSYSMTSAPAAQHLPRHCSATSLKSQGREAAHATRAPPLHVPQMPENRAPFVYPTRLKRPGYRSPSPALSENYAYAMSPAPPPMPNRTPVSGAHAPPPQAYSSYYGVYSGVYSQDPRHLNMRPILRTANSSPGTYDPNLCTYRTGTMQPPPPPPGMMPPTMSMMPRMHQTRPPPAAMPSRAPYQTPLYGPRPGYSSFSQTPTSGYRAQPYPHVAPMAHQMFHNAVRMARNVPHRSDTPMTEAGPPSSDPPSSSSAPESSNPPTPKDHTTIQMVVDPAFINPDSVDLPDSSSEPVLPAKYFDYADGLEKPFHDPEMEVIHPSVPPSGFVQRVKAMLESKTAQEAAAMRRQEKGVRQEHDMLAVDMDHDEADVSELVDMHELAANETPRFTVIEEGETPAELPASPVRVAELEALERSQAQSTERLTREMIKAELGPSSADSTQIQFDDTTRLILGMSRAYVAQQHRSSQSTVEQPARVVESKSGSSSQRTSDEKMRPEPASNTCAPKTIAASLLTTTDNTTTESDENRSNNPFVLESETTITQQTTSSEERLPEQQSEVEPDTSQDLDHEGQAANTPVSPLRVDEDVKRTSAVSPFETEITLGIDETIRLASTDRAEKASSCEGSNSETPHTADHVSPLTPRTPKTYSKSVQIHPSVTTLDTTSTNRFSLPGDLSTSGDTTFNTGSDMVTDIAARFSLPQTAVTVGRPQIVDVSASSTPDKSKQDPQLAQQVPNYAHLRVTRRSSVTFADEVAPLNIPKKPEQHRPLQGAEAMTAKGKSIIRRSSPKKKSEAGYTLRDNATELRFGGNNNIAGISNRFGSAHLPRLKEESIEDMSISDQKRTSVPEAFPLPARIAAVKAMQERRLQECADKAKARRQARKHNRPIADARDLPSLNFSRTDLIDRLNEALEFRSATSMEVSRTRDFAGIHCPTPQRPLSTEPLRERYMSFFNKPEDFSFFGDRTESEMDHEDELESESITEKVMIPTLQIQEQTEIEGVEPEKRPLSPEDFLHVASQVQRLSIPTVNGLSDRLSELIPGLQNLSILQLDSIFASGGDSFRRSLEVRRPDTVMTTRTSAGFRTLAERAAEFVQNGTYDSFAQPNLSSNRDVVALPESASVDKISSSGPSESKQQYLSGSVSAPVDLGKDLLSRPASALLRGKPPVTEEEVQQLLPKGMNPIARNAERATVVSQPSSRPWNLDENYPWGSKVDVDLLVPSVAHIRDSCVSSGVCDRRSRSLDLSKTIEPTHTSIKGIDMGSILTTANLERSASITTEQATGISPQHIRRQSKRSLIGSITRKLGLSSRTATTDEDPTTKSLPSKSPVPARASTQQSHKPGDRYPTSALTPPTGFNLDDVRSFFSDDSSERNRTASFRKRLAHLKGKGKAAVRSDPVRGSSRPHHRNHSMDGDAAHSASDGGSITAVAAAAAAAEAARAGAHSRAHTYDGVGMSKTEFHIKRLGQKLRTMLARGGDLLRSISTRTKASVIGSGRRRRLEAVAAAQDEWLADSLYSGV